MRPARLLSAGRGALSGRALRLGAGLLVWLVLSVALGLGIFLHSSRSLVMSVAASGTYPSASGVVSAAMLSAGPAWLIDGASAAGAVPPPPARDWRP